MTDPTLILRQLTIEGYEGAALVAAFGRWWAALSGADAASAPMRPQAATSGHAKAAMRPPVPRPDHVAPVPDSAPPEGAKAIARKALSLSLLAPAAVAVGSQLVERFNLKTRRCDPGIGTLAQEASVSVRTARRAIKTLEEHGFIGVVPHAGRHHTNAYRLNWPLMVELAKAGEVQGNAAATRPMLSADPVNIVPQNHLKKPDSRLSGGGQSARKSREPDKRQIPMMLPLAGGAQRAEVADDKAGERLWRSFVVHCAPLSPDDRAILYEAYSSLPGIGEAIAAERNRKGSGLDIVLRMLTGPPAAKAG